MFHLYGINVRLEKYLHLTLNLSCPTPTVPPHADFLHLKNKTRHPWCELVQHHCHPYLSLMMKLRRNQRVFLNFWKLINNNYHLKVVVQKYISLKLKISPQKSPSSWMWLVVHFKSKNKSLIKKNLNKSEKIIRLRNNTNDLCIIIKYLVWYFGWTCTYSFNFYCNYRTTFSIMNIIKDKFHNKIEDDIIMESLILYIKRKFVTKLVHY